MAMLIVTTHKQQQQQQQMKGMEARGTFLWPHAPFPASMALRLAALTQSLLCCWRPAGALIAAAVIAALALRRRRRKHSPETAADAARGSSKIGGSSFSAKDLESGMVSDDACRDDFDPESGTMVHRPFGLRRGWSVVHSQVAPHIGNVDDPQIKFGELLGAGSFGRVYHGSWGGKEVAVKVIQHTTETEEVSAAVPVLSSVTFSTV
jgi:hypothetical protein